MVKAYLRYEQSRAFGVIASPEACPVYDDSGKHLVTAALERLSVWDVRRGVEAKSLVPPLRESGATPAVTRIARAEGSDLIAAGASDGSIRLWNLKDGSTDVLLKGHKSEVTALRFNASGTLLVSGGKDTNVVVWDVIAEAGLCRLRGHKDQVTDAVFVEASAGGVGTGGSGGGGGGGGGGNGVGVAAGARLVTCSKDSTVRVWDLDTQHCAQTVAALEAECWSVDVDPFGRRLAVGTSDDRLHLFAVNNGSHADEIENDADSDSDSDDDDGDKEGGGEGGKKGGGKGGKRGGKAAKVGADGRKQLTQAELVARIADASTLLTPMGHVARADRSRAACVRFDKGGSGMLGVQTVGRAVEVYRMRSEAEMAKRLKRKLKRKREKGNKGDKAMTGSGAPWDKSHGDEDEGEGVVAADELELATVVRTKAKTRGFAFAPKSRRRPGIRAIVAVLLDNNSVEEWELAAPEPGSEEAAAAAAGAVSEPTKTRALEAQGHRADVRAVALSPDDVTLVSCSHKGVKVWNPEAGACLRSVEGGYGLCAAFAPGGRHVVVGTKSGALELVDVQAGVQLTGAPDAHAGAIWGIALLPDGSGFLSASADKSVKFWEWRLIDVADDEAARGAEGAEGAEGAGGAEGGGGDGSGTRRELGVAHVKTLQMAEDVLSVKVTPDGKLLSVSLLDNTLKVFFADSLKFFLSLYGHRLPALCHDVSSDSQLLASGGADKNIRIWGLDFGDCHRSIFAHDDSVTAIAFVPKTHYMFSTGKDKSVKYWDADKFEPLLTLSGHHAAAWCVAVSARGGGRYKSNPVLTHSLWKPPGLVGDSTLEPIK
jgi:U3 small nucleolar RNA-associated protein 12